VTSALRDLFISQRC